MAELGFDVVGLDVDAGKVAALNSGVVPFFEPGLPELLRKHVGQGRLRFTTSFAEVAEHGDVHFVCVGTPQQKGTFAADVTYVDAAFTELARNLTRKALLVGKSTVPAGTARRIQALIQAEAPEGVDAELVWNPEFLREGFAVKDTLTPDRLVFGLDNAETSTWALAQIRAAFAPVLATGIPEIVTDYATAELVKVAANSFLATKISFINAMAEVCEVVGADVTQLADAIGHDARIGRRFLNAGLGFGGGCLPKDIRAFIARTEELGVDQAVSFLRDVDAINQRRRARTVDLARGMAGGDLTGVNVAVLGAAFKPDSDDIRDSPALDVAAAIGAEGAHVTVYDPQANDTAAKREPQLDYAPSLEQAVTGADIVMLLTEWQEFRDMDPAHIATLTTQTNIVDGRTVLNPTQWRTAGWNYRSLGRP